MIQGFKSSLGLPTIARTRLSVGGIHWYSNIHNYSALPLYDSMIISPERIAMFVPNKSPY